MPRKMAAGVGIAPTWVDLQSTAHLSMPSSVREIGLVGGTCTRGILLPRQACWLLHYDQVENEIGAASWYCTTSDSEVTWVTAEIASLTSYCRVGNWMQRSELHRRRLAYETCLNTDSPCNVM